MLHLHCWWLGEAIKIWMRSHLLGRLQIFLFSSNSPELSLRSLNSRHFNCVPFFSHCWCRQRTFSISCLCLTVWPYAYTWVLWEWKTLNTDIELTFPKGSISDRHFWNLVITFTNWKDKPNAEQNAQNVSLLRGHCSYGQMWRRVLWKHCKLEHSLNCTTVSQGQWFYHLGCVTEREPFSSPVLFNLLPCWRRKLLFLVP